jgi:CRISPR type III-A-associated RAMP protein Csm4
MPSAIVRFRPTGPWRFGPDSGTRDQIDLIFHSDSLYAAVTTAMLRLNFLEDWLEATANRRDSEPAVRFSSFFPFQRDILYVTPPRSVWPPPPSTKIRFKSARFVPLSVVRALVSEQPIDENRWVIDAESQCMIPSGEGPFRIGLRTAAAIDRMNPAAVDPHRTACIEFGRDAGLWTMVVFSNGEARDRWQPRVRSAFRLLADTGFGGERSRGWGRSSDPEWQRTPDLWPAPETEKAHWLLSLYAPAEADTVEWKTGNYSTVTRTGRVESAADWGALKSPTLMIAEGSVLVSPDAPRGEARNVAPEGFPHSVYRAGFAVTIPIPWRAPGAAPAKPPRESATPVAPAPVSESAPPMPEPEPPSGPAPTAPEPASPTPQPASEREPSPSEAVPPTSQPERDASRPEPPAPEPERGASEPGSPTSEPARHASQPARVASQPVPPTPEPERGPSEPESPTSQPEHPAPEPERPAAEPETPASDAERSASELKRRTSESEPAASAPALLAEPKAIPLLPEPQPTPEPEHAASEPEPTTNDEQTTTNEGPAE